MMKFLLIERFMLFVRESFNFVFLANKRSKKMLTIIKFEKVL